MLWPIIPISLVLINHISGLLMSDFRNIATHGFWSLGPQWLKIGQISHFETADPDFFSGMLWPIIPISLVLINHISGLLMCEFRNIATYGFWSLGPQWLKIGQISHFETADPDFLSGMLWPMIPISLVFINHISGLLMSEFCNIAIYGFWSLGPQWLKIGQISHFETADPDFLSKIIRPIPSI